MLACQDPTERAVSPVVGVMLMLVVTIIIAAIVTAFAGGITQTGDKTPQATLTGQFSQSSGLEMVHSGGDTLTTTNLQVIVRESDNFGNARGYLTPWVINGTFIQNSQGLYWQNATDGSIPGTGMASGTNHVRECFRLEYHVHLRTPDIDRDQSLLYK